MLFDTLEKGNEEIVKKVKQSLQKLNGNTNWSKCNEKYLLPILLFYLSLYSNFIIHLSEIKCNQIKYRYNSVS